MSSSQQEIEKTLGYTLHHLAFNMKSVLKQIFKHSGYEITPESYFLLNLIPEEGIEQQVLVNKTGKDKAAVTRLLDWLTRQDWIIRRVVKTNKRKCIVRLSPEGKKVCTTLNKALANISQPMVKGITSSELNAMYSGLKQLDENLQRIEDKLKEKG
ncbi:MarR family winged helix-turn-helix transcriptional regulator [Catenovulum sediminis]|uniref:HTH marR-type domain-containing protein n=1 Tax=Catenovulum sediminis TaxID=1740262 RepID=A0ABV1RJG4_9ALTE|nr:hypothetical protein [Catenovulum sediminis]